MPKRSASDAGLSGAKRANNKQAGAASSAQQQRLNADDGLAQAGDAEEEADEEEEDVEEEEEEEEEAKEVMSARQLINVGYELCVQLNNNYPLHATNAKNAKWKGTMWNSAISPDEYQQVCCMHLPLLSGLARGLTRQNTHSLPSSPAHNNEPRTPYFPTYSFETSCLSWSVTKTTSSRSTKRRSSRTTRSSPSSRDQRSRLCSRSTNTACEYPTSSKGLTPQP